MKAIPYLFFKGTANEAMAAYAEIFKSPPPEVFSFRQIPAEDQAQMPGVPPDAVMHGALQVGDTWLYCSDDLTGEFTPMAGCSVSITLDTAPEAERVFKALSEGGEVRMPMTEMFFSPAFGTLTDRFGTRWMIMADSEAG